MRRFNTNTHTGKRARSKKEGNLSAPVTQLSPPIGYAADRFEMKNYTRKRLKKHKTGAFQLKCAK